MRGSNRKLVRTAASLVVATGFFVGGMMTTGAGTKAFSAAKRSHQTAKASAPVGSVVFPFPNHGIHYAAARRRLLVAVTSKGPGSFANSVTAIDPSTGKVTGSAFVGSDPANLGVSSDGKFAWVSVNDGSAIRRVDLETMTAGPLMPMPSGRRAHGIFPHPERGDAMLIRHQGDLGPHDSRFEVFADGKFEGRNWRSGNSVVFGVHPSRLFTYQNQSSSFEFQSAAIVGNDILGFGGQAQLFQGFTGFIGSLNGMVVTPGAAYDPETRITLGKLDLNGADNGYFTDSLTGCVFAFKEDGGKLFMHGCDLREFRFLGKIPISLGTPGTPNQMARCGDDMWAARFDDKVALFWARPRPLLPTTDLAVTRAPWPKNAGAGGRVRYDVTVTNKSANPATQVAFSERIPAGVKVEKVTASVGSATFADGVVRAELATLAPGASATFTIELLTDEGEGEARFDAVARAFEPEIDTKNNVASFAPDEPLSPHADLTGRWDELKQVSAGAGLDLQTAVVGSFTVVNQGKATSPPCVVRFYLSDSSRFRVDESLLLQEVTIPALRRGQTYALRLQARLDADVTGAFWCFAGIDAGGAVRESTKANNGLGMKIP